MKNNRIIKFIGGGVAATAADYVVYTFFVMIIFGGNVELAGLSSIISGAIATIVAYLFHSKITWKERTPGKYGVLLFFAWNVLMVALIRPVLVALFSLLTGLYQFAFMIIESIHIPFSYDFVESTGIYVLMVAVTMVLNFFCYEKLVFGARTKVEKEDGEKINVKSVRKPREKEQSNRKGKNNTNK